MTPDAAELRELAEWARAVPREFLSENSPNTKHYERIALILEDLAKLDRQREEAVVSAIALNKILDQS